MTPAPSNAMRDRVAAEARSWIETPYHHMGRVKGRDGGVDCAAILAEVYEAAGVIDHVELPYYPPDWHLHRDEERYLEFVQRYADEAPEGYEPLRGDVVVWKFGRCFSHGAIVTAWPICVHAHVGERVGLVDAEIDARFFERRGVPRERKTFVLRVFAREEIAT